MAGKPTYKVRAVNRKNRDDKPISMFAVWDSKYGFNMTAEKPFDGRYGVVGIVISDGKTEKTIDPNDYFLNMEKPRERTEERAPDGPGDEKDDSQIPF